MLVLMLVLVLMLIAMQPSTSDAEAAKKKASSKRDAKKVAATCMPEAWLSCACIAELCMHTCMHARCIHDNYFVHAQDATDGEDRSSDDDKEQEKKVCLDTHAQMHFVCIECIDVCIGVCMPDAYMTIVSCTRRMLRTKRTAAVMMIKKRKRRCASIRMHRCMLCALNALVYALVYAYQMH